VIQRRLCPVLIYHLYPVYHGLGIVQSTVNVDCGQSYIIVTITVTCVSSMRYYIIILEWIAAGDHVMIIIYLLYSGGRDSEKRTDYLSSAKNNNIIITIFCTTTCCAVENNYLRKMRKIYYPWRRRLCSRRSVENTCTLPNVGGCV